MPHRDFLAKLKSILLNTIFPWQCEGCGQVESTPICDACLSKLERPSHEKCIYCYKPSAFGLTHASCVSPLGLDRCIAVFDYKKGSIDKMIISGKYKFYPEVFSRLGKKAFDVAWKEDQQLQQVGFITYIPLHKYRERWRGFNQSKLFAEIIGKESDLPVVSVLNRNIKTKTQKDLDKVERSKNTANAFSIRYPSKPWWSFLFHDVKEKPPIDLHGKTILLVDDVVTTGSTLKEATKVLKRNGVAKVITMVLASE